MQPILPSDGFSWLYAYVDWDGEWKIGMMNNFRRSQQQWDQCCPRLKRIWFGPIGVANRRRAVAHVLLELRCIDWPRLYCPLYTKISLHR
ncbi:hypothetical protein F5051DRAFT_447878 [Lentinula edodes]|nr:hypothetical protein F5051DRAFT_447878 [Lentinula edodes]